MAGSASFSRNCGCGSATSQRFKQGFPGSPSYLKVTIEAILEFWFGSNPDDSAVAREKAPFWWSKDPRIDDLIRRRFEPCVGKAVRGELTDWLAMPSGRLALILLMDQFPRNMYRDSPQAFACDAKALACCLDGIRRDFDLKLRPIERVFFYLPLEHAESLAHQHRSVQLFRELAAGVGTELRPAFQEYLDFAIRHRDIIARFDRFPHRNKVLGRASTAEELAFLAEPGSSF